MSKQIQWKLILGIILFSFCLSMNSVHALDYDFTETANFTPCFTTLNETHSLNENYAVNSTAVPIIGNYSGTYSFDNADVSMWKYNSTLSASGHGTVVYADSFNGHNSLAKMIISANGHWEYFGIEEYVSLNDSGVFYEIWINHHRQVANSMMFVGLVNSSGNWIFGLMMKNDLTWRVVNQTAEIGSTFSSWASDTWYNVGFFVNTTCSSIWLSGANVFYSGGQANYNGIFRLMTVINELRIYSYVDAIGISTHGYINQSNTQYIQNQTLNVNLTTHFSEYALQDLKNLSLNYAFATNISTPITISIYNFDCLAFNLIQSIISLNNTLFQNGLMNRTQNYVSDGLNSTVNFSGSNMSHFAFNLTQLNVQATYYNQTTVETDNLEISIDNETLPESLILLIVLLAINLICLIVWRQNKWIFGLFIILILWNGVNALIALSNVPFTVSLMIFAVIINTMEIEYIIRKRE